jgi:hypothetical protein
LINNLDSRETQHYNTVSTNITSLQNNLSVLSTKQQSDYDSNLTLINNNKADIDDIKPRLTQAENTILNHSSQITTNTTDIETLKTNRALDRTDIDILLTDNNTNKLTLQNHNSQIQVLQ